VCVYACLCFVCLCFYLFLEICDDYKKQALSEYSLRTICAPEMNKIFKKTKKIFKTQKINKTISIFIFSLFFSLFLVYYLCFSNYFEYPTNHFVNFYIHTLLQTSKKSTHHTKTIN